jgi:hypothetical protein
MTLVDVGAVAVMRVVDGLTLKQEHADDKREAG